MIWLNGVGSKRNYAYAFLIGSKKPLKVHLDKCSCQRNFTSKRFFFFVWNFYFWAPCDRLRNLWTDLLKYQVAHTLTCPEGLIWSEQQLSSDLFSCNTVHLMLCQIANPGCYLLLAKTLEIQKWLQCITFPTLSTFSTKKQPISEPGLHVTNMMCMVWLLVY